MVLCVKGSAEERGRIEVPKVTHRVGALLDAAMILRKKKVR